MDIAIQNISLNIPKTDLSFFKSLAKKMGWTVETKPDMLKKYIGSRPKNIDLSDDDILSEVYAVRYGK
ncbi:MAG: hypothetical protein LBV75_01775 [Paludibacter sp.]|jgi:hypothetical protein|nr:hypothetical protein [Paludibacter sp.]